MRNVRNVRIQGIITEKKEALIMGMGAKNASKRKPMQFIASVYYMLPPQHIRHREGLSELLYHDHSKLHRHYPSNQSKDLQHE